MTAPDDDKNFDEFVKNCWETWKQTKGGKKEEKQDRSAEERALAEEHRQLFAPCTGPVTNFSRRSAAKIRKEATSDSCTIKQVILLRRCDKKLAPTTNDMPKYYNAYLVEDSLTVPKNYNAVQVRALLAAKFPSHLLKIPFEILKKEGRELVKPINRDLNGFNLSVIFYQKKLYIRPSVNLTLKAYENWESDDEDMTPRGSEVKYLRPSHTYVPPRSEDFGLSDDENSMEPFSVNRKYPRRSNTCVPQWHKDYSPISPSDFEDEKQGSSLVEQANHETGDNENLSCLPTLSSLTAELADKLNGESQDAIFVFRADVWQSASIALNSPSFSAEKSIYVIFMDELGQEDGMDSGGLTQEFFSLVLKDARRSDMFAGPEFQRDLSYCDEHLMKNDYKTLGIVLVLSFAHKASQPKFLSPLLYQRPLTLENVHNYEIRSEIEKAMQYDSTIVLQDYLMSTTHLKERDWMVNFTTKDTLVKDMLQYYINELMQKPFEQLLIGLETLDFLTSLRKNPEIWKECFVKEVIPLTAARLRELMDFQYSSAENVKKKEAANLTFFYYFMSELQSGSNGYDLSSLLSFATGYETEPAGGFGRTINLRFMPDDGETKPYPEAASCSFELFLPTWSTQYSDFKQFFYTAFEAKGFLKR